MDGYDTIGLGQCLSTNATGQGQIEEFGYSGLQVVESVTTPLQCAQSCEICLCGVETRGFFYVGFELTFEDKCNCLLNYETYVNPGSGELTRRNLTDISEQCSLFNKDAIIPATGALYMGEGPVIGSVGYGDKYLCYSVSGTYIDYLGRGWLMRCFVLLYFGSFTAPLLIPLAQLNISPPSLITDRKGR